MSDYKQLFFPIGGGDELAERLYGAFLIAKHFKTNLRVMKCQLNAVEHIYKTLSIPKQLMKDIGNVIDAKTHDEDHDIEEVFEKAAKKADIEITEKPAVDRANTHLYIKEGIRSFLVEEESKFCDLVVLATPPFGVATATFETAVLKSGKPILMFPRIMTKFKMDSVIIGWDNSPETSRAISFAINILKNAQRVHIVSSNEYVKNMDTMQELIQYLACHGIEASFDMIKTGSKPGKTLLNTALDENFDLIVAGAYGHKGLKNLMFGGATSYLLKKSPIPIFMSH